MKRIYYLGKIQKELIVKRYKIPIYCKLNTNYSSIDWEIQ